MVSVSNVYNGIEHRSYVQKNVQSKSKRWTLVMWYAGDKGLFTSVVPLNSDVDLVSMQTAFHN